MTCIVELICRGNIRNIDNDKFELVSKDNLLDYEEQLTNLIFNEKSIISFSEINEMFIKSNKDTSFFVKEFKQIKKKILNKLFELEIYNKKGETILGVIKTINILNYMNIFLLLKNIIYTGSYNFIIIFIINIIALLIINLYKHLIKENKDLYRKTGKGFSLSMSLMLLLILGIISLILSLKQHYIILIMILILIILNIITTLKSKLHILTKTGKEEYAKVYGLKSYIVDFSLMNERDVDGAIIWDEYLAYAVAFSIPNKITNRFKSELMEINIILQNIDKFITS